MDYIAATDLKIDRSDFLPGDRIDRDQVVNKLGERTFEILTKAEQIVPLTRAKFETYSVRRPAGSPWPPAGFTEAFLVEKGVIDRARGASEPKPEVKKTIVTQIALTEEKVAVGPYFYQPKLSGRFTYWDVIDQEGKLLRATAFRKEGDAKAFLEELFTKPADADTSTAGAGGGDGGDIQAGADGRGEPDPSTDRGH